MSSRDVSDPPHNCLKHGLRGIVRMMRAVLISELYWFGKVDHCKETTVVMLWTQPKATLCLLRKWNKTKLESERVPVWSVMPGTRSNRQAACAQHYGDKKLQWGIVVITPSSGWALRAYTEGLQHLLLSASVIANYNCKNLFLSYSMLR